MTSKNRTNRRPEPDQLILSELSKQATQAARTEVRLKETFTLDTMDSKLQPSYMRPSIRLRGSMMTRLTKRLVVTLAWNWKNMAVGRIMNKERVLFFSVTAVVLGLSIVLVVARLQHSARGLSVALPDSRPNEQEMKSIEYNVGRVIRSSNEPHEVTVIISIDPKYFTHNDMVKLAHQLKRDFADELLLRVEILDDKNIADNYVPAGDMYRLFNEAKRGTYVLNRNTGREHLEFSTARGKPMDQVKIDSTEPN